MKFVRYSLPHIINDNPDTIQNKIYTQSLLGFMLYKICLLNNYSYYVLYQIVIHVN